MSRTITPDDVRAGYAAYNERWKYRNGLAPRLDLAEVLTGESWVQGNSFAGRNRETEMRKYINIGSFDRSIQALIDEGWLVQVSLREAERRGLQMRGAQPNGRYYVSAEIWEEARLRTGRRQRNLTRQRLHDRATGRILEIHQQELEQVYHDLCVEAGLDPEKETS